jgi:hypothetical protein
MELVTDPLPPPRAPSNSQSGFALSIRPVSAKTLAIIGLHQISRPQGGSAT